MGRAAFLFLLVGLALGLWLGFNPAAHRDIVRWWNREVAAQTDGKPHAAAAVRQLNSRLTRSLENSPKPLARSGSQPNSVPTLNQIGAELHAFWLALERIWLNFAAKLRM